MNLHLLTFGSPKEKYNWTLDRLKKEANYVKIFKSINVFTEEDIFDFCPELESHKKFMTESRGFGYWIWKYFLISKLFEHISNDEVVLYLDAGSTINENGLDRLVFYYEMAIKNEMISFQMEHLENQYTKRDTYDKIFLGDEKYYQTGQIHASCFLIKKTENTINFIEEIKKLCTEENYRYINDNQSIKSNEKTFIDHRHDQSIFSLMVKKYNFCYIPDETYWHPNWNYSGKEYPLWVTRIK